MSFLPGGGLPKIGGIRYFFLDQKGIKNFFKLKGGSLIIFLKETKYFVKHFRFQRKGLSDATEQLGDETFGGTF